MLIEKDEDSGFNFPYFLYSPPDVREKPLLVEPVNSGGCNDDFQTDLDAAEYDDTVFFNSAGTLYAVNADGDLVWKKSLADPSSGTPAIVNDTLYIGENIQDVNAGYLVALDTATGERRWRTKIPYYVPRYSVAPTVADGTVYIGSNKLVAIDTNSGSVTWEQTDVSPVGGYPPAVANGLVYLLDTPARNPDRVSALSVSDGSKTWDFTYNPGRAAPVVANGYVYLGGVGELFARNASDGSSVWHTTLGSGSNAMGPMGVADGTLYVGFDDLYAVNTATGEVQWSRNLAGSTAHGGLVADGVVYASSNGVYYAFDADSGTQLWSYNTGEDTGAPPAVTAGRVHTVTSTYNAPGYVLAIDGDTTLNAAPTASFDFSPSQPSVGESITFDASGSSDSDGSIATYDWSFGDGSNMTGKTVTHSYGSLGDYSVSLTVTDSDGATAQATRTVSVSGESPSAAFEVSPPEPAVGGEISVDASASSDPDTTIARYEWDFTGDGTIDATGKTAVWTYSDLGDQEISLTVYDETDRSATASKTVTVALSADEKLTIAGHIDSLAADPLLQNRTVNGTTVDGDEAYAKAHIAGLESAANSGSIEATTTKQVVDRLTAAETVIQRTLEVLASPSAIHESSDTTAYNVARKTARVTASLAIDLALAVIPLNKVADSIADNLPSTSPVSARRLKDWLDTALSKIGDTLKDLMRTDTLSNEQSTELRDTVETETQAAYDEATAGDSVPSETELASNVEAEVDQAVDATLDEFADGIRAGVLSGTAGLELISTTDGYGYAKTVPPGLSSGTVGLQGGLEALFDELDASSLTERGLLGSTEEAQQAASEADSRASTIAESTVEEIETMTNLVPGNFVQEVAKLIHAIQKGDWVDITLGIGNIALTIIQDIAGSIAQVGAGTAGWLGVKTLRQNALLAIGQVILGDADARVRYYNAPVQSYTNGGSS